MRVNTKPATVLKRTREERSWMKSTSSAQGLGWLKSAASLPSSPCSSCTSFFPTWCASTTAISWRKTSPASSRTFQNYSSGQFLHLVWVFLGPSMSTRPSRKEGLLTLEWTFSVGYFSLSIASVRSHQGYLHLSYSLTPSVMGTFTLWLYLSLVIYLSWPSFTG